MLTTKYTQTKPKYAKQFQLYSFSKRAKIAVGAAYGVKWSKVL
jgi:hypothetical protein